MPPPPTGEHLRQPSDDLVQHRLQRLVGWGGHFDEDRFAFGVVAVYAVQHQAVKVNVEIGRRAKALDQRDCAAVSLLGLQTRLPEQVARDDAVHHLQHRRHQLGLCGQQQVQQDGQPNLANPNPLAHRHVRSDVIEQVRRRLYHAPGPARRAEAASFAAVGHKLVVAGVAAMQAQKAVGQDAAFEEGVELVPHKLGQAGAGLPIRSARRRWRRAAAPAGTAWFVRGGGARSELGRRPAR